MCIKTYSLDINFLQGELLNLFIETILKVPETDLLREAQDIYFWCSKNSRVQMQSFFKIFLSFKSQRLEWN